MKKQPNSRMCFTCGEENPAGVHVCYYEQEDGSVLARFTGQDHHQGYPNRMHGGVIAAILDETIGRAIMARSVLRTWGVTKEIRVRYRQPAPLGIELTAVGRITAEDERYFEGTGELRLADGTVAAEAHAKYRKLDMEQIGDFDPQREKWAVGAD
jgi:acyl-coenzyme A thioesterase PaaI-like protein